MIYNACVLNILSFMTSEYGRAVINKNKEAAPTPILTIKPLYKSKIII